VDIAWPTPNTEEAQMFHTTRSSRSPVAAAVGLAALLGLSALLPTPAFAQASYNWRNVEIVGGGYVPGIVFNTSEPNLIYARTDIGGAYRWNPSTNRWVRR
jgi:xyloglucan-specific exo-beta-1,4-glucanase